jgi:hypothetical protein
MPRFAFENKITMGGLIQIIVMISGIAWTWSNLVGATSANTTDILRMQEAIKPIESLNIRLTVVESGAETADKRQSEIITSLGDLIAAINNDRINASRTDAEIRRDVGYLRDWVEEQKRKSQ